MAVKNLTQWAPPSGTGFISASTGAAITTQSLLNLTTQSGTNLTLSADVFKPRYATSWTKATKGKTSWNTSSGTGYVITVATKNIVTNAGLFLVDNSGNFIVTTTTYNVPRNLTQWTLSGA